MWQIRNSKYQVTSKEEEASGPQGSHGRFLQQIMKVEVVRAGAGYYTEVIAMMKNSELILEASGVIKDFCAVK